MKIYTMTKEVLGCKDCPRSRVRSTNFSIAFCGNEDAEGYSVQAESIPEWCPLPDVKVKK
jgi:hypothetical protein